ncbi:MAG: hypothetical protein MZU97_20705 [Bacillus subtilis]|nr:hypothetical protein [Bacillus subtilis]
MMIPSCVPATPFETAGATIVPADDIRLSQTEEQRLGFGRSDGLSGRCLSGGSRRPSPKITPMANRPIDGHSPGL